MLTINTNLSSLIAQNNLKQTTNLLNQAIERMSSGFKINHAKDNAANSSIINNMSSKISSLQVAEDNVMQGLDMISTANGVLDEINDRVQRLRDLQEQASNGTYGEQSLKAINMEVNALIDEINRMYQTTNYNNVVLFEKNEVIDDGTMAIKREVSANENSTFKELGISNSSMEIYDIDDNLIATIDIEEEDTIGDLFTALNGEGFQTKINNGQITISSFNGDYVAGDLADALGISKQIKTYVVSTEQSFDNELTKTLSSTETLTDTITTTTSETITETIRVTTTTSETLTETIWTTTTTSETLTETIYITTTTSTTNTETVTETIQVETTTVTSTETITTIYTSQTEELKIVIPGEATNKTYTDTQVASMKKIQSYSSFTSGQKYKIETAADLAYLATRVNAGASHTGAIFVLANDIDLSSYSNWTPIVSFKGLFDGNGHVISNLTIDNDSENYQGLFGSITGVAEIKNVGLEDVNVIGGHHVGGLVGSADYTTTITNCYITGTVGGSGSEIGGLVGVNWSSLTYCHAMVTVSGTSFIGGLVGVHDGSIANCYATGNVSGDYAGGLVGLAQGENDISNCYATGQVIGRDHLGGLIGSSDDYTTISNCYSTGNISGQESVGGLVGYSSSETSINNCYATGTASGDTDIGGFVGKTPASSPSTITNCASVKTDSYATRMTTTKISTTYTPDSMSFTEANGWKIVDGKPLLAWQEEANLPTTVSATATTTLGEFGVSSAYIYLTDGTKLSYNFTGSSTFNNILTTLNNSGKNINAELINGILSVTGNNNIGIDLTTGSDNLFQVVPLTQNTSYNTTTNSTTQTIMVDKEVETEVVETIWTTTTSSTTETSTITVTTTVENTITETIWTTTTTSETATETIYTTTTSEQTRTETIYTTNTITLSDSTKLEELGVLSSLRVTVLTNGTRSTFELNKDSTLNDFYSALNTKGITTSVSGNNIVLTGSGDTFIDSHNIKELLELSNVTKTNGNKTINTESDRFVHFTYVRGLYAPGTVTLQVGTNSDEYSKIDCDVYFKLDDLSDVRNMGLNNNNYLEQIDKVLKAINERQTSFGAIQNRLESALEEISIRYENLVSSRSTLRDADIAEVSSKYIQQQILQQVSATLLSTANQTPSIALQLI